MIDFEKDSDKTPILLHPAKRIELLNRGQELFNDEKFFEAHEAWEELWHCEQGRDRIFVQALIQIAGHFVHIQKMNWSGAQGLAFAAKEKFRMAMSPTQRLYRELDLAAVFSALEYNISLLRKITPTEPAPVPEQFLVPKIF